MTGNLNPLAVPENLFSRWGTRRVPMRGSEHRSLGALLVSGFALLVALGCADTDQDVYFAGEPAIATLENTLNTPIYLPGCAPFVTERLLNGDWVFDSPPFVCVWEGIAVELGPNESIDTAFHAPTESGLYRVRYSANAGCEPDLPLSEANCQLQDIPRHAEFEVVREPCDPSEFGCRFVPGAPNYLCPDGENFGGPAAECTRDPATGTCGYEFLSCP